MSVVRRARALFGAGWTPHQIRDLLQEELGVRPHETTIRLWCDPVYAEQHRAESRKRMRVRWQRDHPPRPQKISAELALVRMQEMYRRGLSLRAIGVVAGMWWGEELSVGQVRRRLGLGQGEIVPISRRAA
jgi:hypothetical protein